MAAPPIFATRIPVRFNHVDAAGIVFYPRYYEMLNEVVERWLEEAVGTSFHELHTVQGRGLPARSIGVEFMKASRLGDVLTFELRVAKLGRSSIELAVQCSCGGERRLTARLVLVFVALAPLAAVAIPENLRRRMALFCAPA